MRRLMILCLMSAGIGCKKDNIAYKPVVSLSVANVIVGGKTVRLNSSTVDSATNYNYKSFALLAGNSNVYLYPSGDSSHPYFTRSIQSQAGDLYTLFLAGSATANVDTVFLKDNVIQYPDSSCGIRFINLCYNGSAIIVTQSSTPTTVDFPSMAYKQISVFKTFPALAANNTYTFQIRDAATNTVLTTYVLTTPRFFNCTLIWKGMIGGTGANAPGILRMNHYQ